MGQVTSDQAVAARVLAMLDGKYVALILGHGGMPALDPEVVADLRQLCAAVQRGAEPTGTVRDNLAKLVRACPEDMIEPITAHLLGNPCPSASQRGEGKNEVTIAD